MTTPLSKKSGKGITDGTSSTPRGGQPTCSSELAKGATVRVVVDLNRCPSPSSASGTERTRAMLAARLNVKTLTLYLDDGAGLIIQGIGLRQNPMTRHFVVTHRNAA